MIHCIIHFIPLENTTLYENPSFEYKLTFYNLKNPRLFTLLLYEGTR